MASHQLRVACSLLLLVLALVLAGPVPELKGRESVFNYLVTVGKQTTSAFEQGFQISSKVIARQRSDGAYNIRLSEVTVRCSRNNEIDKDKYKELESALAVPFDFDPTTNLLRIYSPETLSSESVNIKRGLVNLLEVYDDDSKQLVKLSTSTSSGKCLEIESTASSAEDGLSSSSRFSNLATNCSNALSHQIVTSSGVAKFGTFCNVQPKVSRNLNVKVQRSAVGAASPTLNIHSNERLALESSFPNGLFDSVLAKSQLTLTEVRDGSALDWTQPAESATTSTEVDISQPTVYNQEENLKRSIEGFKMIGHCLDKFEKGDHLEDQDLPDLIVGLSFGLAKLSKASLDTLYKSIDGSHKNAAFFQLLGLVGSRDTFLVVRDLYLKALADGSNTYKLAEEVATYFERIDPKTRSFDATAIKEMTEFYHKLAANDKTHPRLKTAVILTASALYSTVCNSPSVASSDPACPTGERLASKLSALDSSNDELTLIKIKVIANSNIKEGIPLLKAIISEKTRPIHQRAQATWALVRLAPRYGRDLNQYLLQVFFDSSEDHEVRIAAYISIARTGSNNELTSVISYIVDNAESEDCQVVHYVISSVKSLRHFRNPTGSACPNFGKPYVVVWESMVEKVVDKYGPKTLFDSSLHLLQSESGRESVLISTIASKSDVLPRSLYVSARDQLQARSVSINVVSDGLVYSNLAKLKAAHDQMRQVTKTVDVDVKRQLAAVLDAVEQVRPTSGNFSLLFAGQNDGLDTSFESFTRPEQILHRLLARTVSSERYLRSFNKYNDVRVRTHTESGLRVSFATAQGALTSVEVPAFTLGQMGRTGLPVSFQYSYKFVSRTFYATVASLPNSKYKYVSGRVSDKAVAIPRNVTMNLMRRQVDTLTVTTIKGRSDPLRGGPAKDTFLRSLTPFAGNLLGFHETKKLHVKESRPLTVVSRGHDYLGFGMTIEQSADYKRPSPFSSPLTRWCYRYQEIDGQVTPYTFKVSLSPNPVSSSSSQASWQLNIVDGLKSGQYVKLATWTLDSPLDSSKKAVRVSLGTAIDTNDPNKRLVLTAYENSVKKLYVRSRYSIQMPTTSLAVPRVTKGAEWSDVYATEQIALEGTGKFSESTRSEFDLDGDLGDLLTPFTEPDTTGKGHYYRTEEQASLFGNRDNSVEGDGVGDDIYSKLIGASQKHAKANFRAWDSLLKFHGLELEVTATRPPPEAVTLLWRRLNDLLVKKHYAYLSYGGSDDGGNVGKLEPGHIKIQLNSTVDSQRSDLTIQDRNGRLQFQGFKSRAIIPYLRPSSSPIKVFHTSALNLPVCTLSASAERSQIETFDGLDISADELRDGCSYLLAGNCRGRRTFAVSYSRADNKYTILYDDQYKIVISETGFEVNGVAQADKEGLVGKVGEVVLLSYKGLLKVILPNRVEVIREKNSSIGYVKASNIFRGRLCGLCGDLDGNMVNDKVNVDSLGSGSCAAAAAR